MPVEVRLGESISLTPGFDIIGDVHGHADKLEALLLALGYQQDGAGFIHPRRKAIFVGDVIDRGPNVRRVVDIVVTMVESNSAYFILGNHEINFINWHRQIGLSGNFAFPHSKSNQLQLHQTLRAYSEEEQLALVDWLVNQPLFLEFPNFRVIHASWDQRFVTRYLEQFQTCCLSIEALRLSDTNPWLLQGIDRVTRGVNIRLPEGHFVMGNDGISRRRVRAKFWSQSPQVLGDVILQDEALPDELHHFPLTAIQQTSLVHYGPQERPLFVGHYWQAVPPRIFTHNIACVDFSAAGRGPLVAYRWNQGDESLIDSQYFHL